MKNQNLSLEFKSRASDLLFFFYKLLLRLEGQSSWNFIFVYFYTQNLPLMSESYILHQLKSLEIKLRVIY